jgi:hypothetical protein
MTNKKMQCYVKSVKTDTDGILTKLKPAIINFFISVGVLIGFLLVIALISMVLIYSQQYIKALFDAIGSLFAIVFQDFLTQYNTYLVCMIVIDFISFLFIRVSMTDSIFNADERDPYGHVLNSVGALFVLFAFNGMMVFITMSNDGVYTAGNWDELQGWSFMLCETAINMIVVVAGILLYRAYLKCENKIVPSDY